MIRRTLVSLPLYILACALALGGAPALAAEEAPEALIKRLSAEVLDGIRRDASIRSGDVRDRKSVV